MRFLACAIGAVVLTSVVVQAQWPTYKTQGVPRTRSGEINLAAPAPKAPDGKPDLSGLWENPSTPPTVNSSIAGTGGAPPIPGTPPREPQSQGGRRRARSGCSSTSVLACPAAFRFSLGRWRSRSSAWQTT